MFLQKYQLAIVVLVSTLCLGTFAKPCRYFFSQQQGQAICADTESYKSESKCTYKTCYNPHGNQFAKMTNCYWVVDNSGPSEQDCSYYEWDTNTKAYSCTNPGYNQYTCKTNPASLEFISCATC
ncbi:uncharacterized protein MELLADRAFT_124037 [Melampsora larici-populina 98AG31]|uniref:Secreted protein n=1 Tax=Melampsora larici-populina (strain 98AG31 / pathotype 3-4-7) TaxID=747676 RepID=F4RQS5_MELLP|nr:uncharacterized protein MELLADRAFT_124037 [Melampsora larici-populina 98AG31]EGG05271.1 secreted protein [Melampsora larici-populina 98AG31]